MSVWYCVPSKRPVAEAEKCISLWRRQGYRIILWRDPEDERWPIPSEQLLPVMNHYPGYARAVNALIDFALVWDQECQWVVTGGDDVEPDLNHTADEIAQQCSEHFALTFGVMQPTGDRFANGSIDRICGSPWIGRSFAQRINRGIGPLWPAYTHCFVDEELQHVAIKHGVLWQRRDLIHLHRHYQRQSADVNSAAVPQPMPEFLAEANSREHWDKYKQLFVERRIKGFPGSEPL